MGFWCRINQSNLRHLNHLLKRCNAQASSLNFNTKQPRNCIVDNPLSSIVHRPTCLYNNARSFAAPVQYQKEEKQEASGPRLNHQIRAQYVRLVLDEGHKIVSIHEALKLSEKLDLDLVEVQRNADPPVCRIMDYHKEKYKKELHEKERAKSKSEATLKSDSKEVRFSGKIEQKDLQMKADTVKRLIDRGYRVKCMALPVNKKGTSESEDLGGYLSRLLALVEDTSIVESGPHVEKKQAFAVIRHVKFGPKKSGGKKSKTSKSPSGHVSDSTTSEEDFVGLEDEDESVNDEVDLPSAAPMQARYIPNNQQRQPDNNFSKDQPRSPPLPQTSYDDSYRRSGPPPQTSYDAETRYRRNEPNNPPLSGRPLDSRGPGPQQYPNQRPQQFPFQQRQPPPNVNVPPAMGESNRMGTRAPAFRNTGRPNNMPNQEQPRSSFGVFSTPQTNTSRQQGAPDRSHTPARNPSSGGVESNQSPGADNTGEKKFGIFSK